VKLRFIGGELPASQPCLPQYWPIFVPFSYLPRHHLRRRRNNNNSHSQPDNQHGAFINTFSASLVLTICFDTQNFGFNTSFIASTSPPWVSVVIPLLDTMLPPTRNVTWFT
jgi:hypothetical protein